MWPRDEARMAAPGRLSNVAHDSQMLSHQLDLRIPRRGDTCWVFGKDAVETGTARIGMNVSPQTVSLVRGPAADLEQYTENKSVYRLGQGFRAGSPSPLCSLFSITRFLAGPISFHPQRPAAVTHLRQSPCHLGVL